MDYIKRVERVALAVEDLDAAQKFFEQWFGAKFCPEENIEDILQNLEFIKSWFVTFLGISAE